MRIQRFSCIAALLLCVLASRAFSQYLYLDTNGDGVWSSDDRLNPDTTTVRVWLNTNHDRDGSTRVCNDHTGAPGSGSALAMFSFDLIFRADGGTVTYSAFSSSPGFGANGTEVKNDIDATVHRARPLGSTVSGLQLLGYMTITVTAGSPAVGIANGTSIDPTAYGSGFGTNCDGSVYPNTYFLGRDWFDADGVQPPDVPPTISAPSSLTAGVGSEVMIQAEAVDSLSEMAPTITAQGYPVGLTFSVSQIGTKASRATLNGRLGTNDAGMHTIIWTATDQGGLSTNSTTVMDVSSQSQTSDAVIVGYTTNGPDVIVSEGANGIDATLGRWGFVYPNGPCGDPVSSPCTEVFNRIDVEIDVQTGGILSFSYEFKQYGTPFISECLNAYIYDPSSPFPGRTYLAPGTAPPSLGCFGNPEPCWGTLWQSARSTVSVNLGNWPNRHVFLVIGVADCYGHGTDAQAHINSIAIRACPVAPLSPLSAEDQLFEDNENRWDEAGLTTEMRAALDCFRTKVLAGGFFDISRGSAYRTPGYQAHLQEVWDKYDLLMDKNIPACQALKDQLAYEIGPSKHALATRPGDPGRSPHPRGLAFDATVTGVNQDSLAWTCGLYRPYKDRSKKNKRIDCPHFELLGGRPKPTFGGVSCP